MKHLEIHFLKHLEIWFCDDSSFSVLGKGNMHLRTVSKPGAGLAGREQSDQEQQTQVQGEECGVSWCVTS